MILLPTLCAGLVNTVSPRRLAWVKDWSDHVARQAEEEGLRPVDLGEARAIVSEGTHIIFDARPLADYDAGHIPTAMSLPFMEMHEQFSQYQMLLTPEQPVMVYCSGKECDESLELGKFLFEQGLTNIFIFVGGYDAWEAAE